MSDDAGGDGMVAIYLDGGPLWGCGFKVKAGATEMITPPNDVGRTYRYYLRDDGRWTFDASWGSATLGRRPSSPRRRS